MASFEASGGREATRAASSSAAESHSRLPVTWLTMPIRAASSASKRRPVRISSIARCLPTARARRWVPPPPGMIPRVISGWPNSAVSEATIMSQIRASSQPPPSAKPETAAISGVRHSATRFQNAAAG